MYISLWENSRGHPIMLVLCNYLRQLMVSNKKIHRALRTHTTLMNNTHYRNISFSPFTKTILWPSHLSSIFMYFSCSTVSYSGSKNCGKYLEDFIRPKW